MGGIGPAPKPKAERRNRSQPARGEWVDLEPLETPVLPLYNPRRFTATRRLWNGWRSDPVTSQYGPADIEAIVELGIHWAEMTFADQDRRMDKLGLTPKGKRDLRWRTPNEVKTIKAAEAKVRELRIVK